MRPKGAHPRSGTVSVFFCLAAVSAAGSASALLGIGAADAGLPPFFRPVQIEEDAPQDRRNDGNYNEIHHSLSSGGGVGSVQAVLLLDVPGGAAGQSDHNGDHHRDAHKAGQGSHHV